MPRTTRPTWVLARRREIGHRIARHREARGWTVDELAGEAGIGRVTVVRVENAARSTGIDVLIQIAGALGITVGRLLDEDPADTGTAGDGRR